jgi:sugar transferase (PEP-CTERM/EpsH1 system associated)
MKPKTTKPNPGAVSQPIRVMHVIHSLDVGGAEQVVANYARHLDRTRFSSSVCALRSGGPLFDQLREEGVPVFLIGKRAGADPRALWRLVRLLRREKIEIVHTHNPTAHLWGLAAARLAGRLFTIGTEHSVHYSGRGGRFFPLLFKHLAKTFDCVIACSESARKSHVQSGLLQENKYVTIHNGIERKRFSQGRTSTRRRSSNPGHLTIGTIGSLTSHKGHSYLISAVAELRDHGLHPTVVIVGDGPLRAELADKIGELGLTEQVLLVGVTDNIPALLADFDIFVLPSLREGFPITLLEAMASGLPVIATDVGGNGEAVLDGENGVIVQHGDSNKLASALRMLIENPELARRMGERGERRVAEHFSVEQMTAATEKIYEKAILRSPQAKTLKEVKRA